MPDFSKLNILHSKMPAVSGIYAEKVWAGWENWGGLKTVWTPRPGIWASATWSSDGGQEPDVSQYWSCLMSDNDLDNGTDSTARVLTQNWEWQFVHRRNCATIQRHLDRGEVGWQWISCSSTKGNAEFCIWGEAATSITISWPGVSQLGNSFVGKELVSLVNTKLTMS